MAAAAAAALLDELMGRNRNILPNEKPKEINWEDPEFCKLYFVKFCPHDLFVNTRADLGVCTKVHDDEAKELYEKAPYTFRKQQYEDEFIRFCQSMLSEVERKIVKGKQRLALIGNKDMTTLSPAQTQKNEEQIALLSEKINKLVEEAEQCGIQGNVEQAQGLMRLCDQLKEERETLQKSNDNSHYNQVNDSNWTAELAAAQEKQMEVCDVCGAFLIVGDAQQRIDDHLMGKQHVGYARLKAALQDILDKREKDREDKERRRDDDRRRARGGDDDRRRRDRNRDRDHERRDVNRDRRDRDRNRDRDRIRDRETENDNEKDDRHKRREHDMHRNNQQRSKSSESREKHDRHKEDDRRYKDRGNHDHHHKSRNRHRSRSPSRK